MRRKVERGVALVATVGAMALLSFLVLALAQTAATAQSRTARALAGLQAEALARSGIVAARALLAVRPDEADTLVSPWIRPSGPQALGAGQVEVTIEDEARRLDVNAPELFPVLPRLLAILRLDPRLAANVLDWIDADDEAREGGSERHAYLGLTPSRRPANAPFGTAGELALVRGIDGAVLARLLPLITVAGEHGVNPNTASPEVLRALLDDPQLVDRLLARRATVPIVPEDVPPPLRVLLTFRSRHYRVRARAEVADTRREIEAGFWAPGPGEPTLQSWRALTR